MRAARVRAAVDFDDLVDRFATLAGVALEGMAVDIWPYNSGASFVHRDAAARFVRQHFDLFALAGFDLRGRAIAEAGTGYGFSLVLCALAGAARADGIEFAPDAAAAVAEYLQRFPAAIAARIDVREGDAAAMPYGDGEYDALLSIEAISHYRDVDSFLEEAARVLKPGGVLLISDGNNGANPRIRTKNLDIWEAFEQGSPGAQVHGHTVLSSYMEQRRAAIADAFPRLDDGVVDDLARRTSGFTAAEAVEAAAAWSGDGPRPEQFYRRGALAYSPTGMAMERLLEPHALARDIERHGFSARAYGYWGGASGKRSLRAANRVLTACSRITMPTAPGFRIVARRI